MKLLICTQAVDTQDPILGFFHQWIEELAKYYDEVHVICLREGEHGLPQHVTVDSLGKVYARESTFFDRVRYAWRFGVFIWKLRDKYDAVFVHMNPEYVVLGAPLWRLLRKRVVLWYTHKSVTPLLRMAETFVDAVATASQESFRVPSEKVHVLGHGIDTKMFSCRKKKQIAPPRIVTVGRISPTKCIDEMLDILLTLHRRDIPAALTIVGEATTQKEKEYERMLTSRINSLPAVVEVFWKGALNQEEVSNELCNADIFLNLSKTGSLDKAVLEGMASGAIPVTTNEGLRSTLEKTPNLVCSSYEECATRITELTHMSAEEDTALREYLRHVVVHQHNLAGLTKQLHELLTV